MSKRTNPNASSAVRSTCQSCLTPGGAADELRTRRAFEPAFGLAAQQVQHAVAEFLRLDGVVVAVARIEDEADLALNVAVPVVGGLLQRLLAAAVRDVVATKAVIILV